jgi:hypothetical protein
VTFAAGDFGLGELTRAAAERERIERAARPPVIIPLTAEGRKRALAMLERPDSPLNLAWLRGKLDHKNHLADEVLSAARTGAAQAGPEATAVVEELVQQHRDAIAETERQKARARHEAEQAERQRQIDARVAAWAAVDRPQRERLILLEFFTKDRPGSARDLVLAMGELAEVTDAELDSLIPATFRPLDGAPASEPALLRRRADQRLHAWRRLSPESRRNAVLVDMAVRGLPLLETAAVDDDEPPSTWRR